MNNIFLFGCGKTTRAISNRFNVSKIYDDNNLDDNLCYNSKEFPTLLNSNDILIPTPAIPPHHQIIQKFQNNIISEYDLYYLNNIFPYSIWISGTNGKTTTTEMITFLLQDRGAESGGNIGTPLGELNHKSPIWVLETSSFTLHYTKYAKPNLYILLPITPDHENWHGTFQEYEKSKLKPLQLLKEGEVAIVPDKYGGVETNGYLITYKNEIDLANRLGIDISQINYSGGFLLDAVLALATSKILFDEVDYKKINNFKPSPHRQEEIFDSQGRVWINDSKATNPASTISCLQGIDNNKNIFLILGGEDKGADWNYLFEYFSEKKIKIFAIGKSVNKALTLAKKFNIQISKSETLYQAIKEISKEHNKNSVAILSPASASFDQFKSYQERGDKFKKLITTNL